MYPTLGDFFNDIFGTSWNFPLPMFGFWFAMAFVSAAYFLRKEFKRKEEMGLFPAQKKKVLIGAPAKWTELLGNAFVGFILGFKILYLITHWSEAGTNLQGIILSGKGSLIGGLIGAALFGFWAYREKESRRLETPEWRNIKIFPHQQIGDIVVLAAVAGILGSKIFHYVEYPEQLRGFWEDPSSVITSGMTFYGGLICAALVLVWWARKRKIPVLHFMDSAAPSLILGYGVGRIGCQMAGDGDWGLVNSAPKPDWMSFLPDWMWSFNYPNNVLGECNPYTDERAHQAICNWSETPYLIENVWPTAFYEVLMALAIFGLLWAIRKRVIIPGVLFSIYLIFNGMERFSIEFIRVNPQYKFLGLHLSQAQLIAVGLMALGVIGAIFFSYRYKRNKVSG